MMVAHALTMNAGLTDTSPAPLYDADAPRVPAAPESTDPAPARVSSAAQDTLSLAVHV